METPDDELTVQELQRAIGGMLIVLGSMVPPPVGRHMAEQLKAFADQCTRGGDSSVGTLCRGFAQALDEGSKTPRVPRH